MNIEDILGGSLTGKIDVKLEIETKDTHITTESATHQMAVDVLKGADAATMAVKTIKDASTVVNEEVMKKLGLTYSGIYTAVSK